jgi:hypothetical protein
MAEAKYAPLKAFILRRGPMRLTLHATLRDRLVDQIVEDWPIGCPPDRLEEVILARLSVRLRERHGSIVALFLIGLLAQVIVRLILEWWFEKNSHRILLTGWAHNAQVRSDLPPPAAN